VKTMISKNPKYVSSRLGISAGRSSITSTADIYSSAFQRADKKAADKLQNLFKKKPVDKPVKA